MKIIFLTLLLSISVSLKAFSCSCTGISEYSNSEMSLDWYNNYEFVFSAVVDSVRTEGKGWPQSQTAFFTTKKIYKGNVPEYLSISPPGFNSSCRFNLAEKVGITYIIYGFKTEEGKIQTHFCHGTMPLFTNEQLDTIKAPIFMMNRMRQELKFLDAITKVDNGEVRIKYSNGVLQAKGEFKDRIPHGKWTYYNYYGKKVSEGIYLNGLKSDKWIEYGYEDIDPKPGSKNVKLKNYEYSEGLYLNGKKEGEWKTFNSNGKLMYSETFNKGETTTNTNTN